MNISVRETTKMTKKGCLLWHPLASTNNVTKYYYAVCVHFFWQVCLMDFCRVICRYWCACFQLSRCDVKRVYVYVYVSLYSRPYITSMIYNLNGQRNHRVENYYIPANTIRYKTASLVPKRRKTMLPKRLMISFDTGILCPVPELYHNISMLM